ncbi:MAG: hypothetical protein ACRDV4_09205, partial [Acidimicrobiales bacterium]
MTALLKALMASGVHWSLPNEYWRTRKLDHGGSLERVVLPVDGVEPLSLIDHVIGGIQSLSSRRQFHRRHLYLTHNILST